MVATGAQFAKRGAKYVVYVGVALAGFLFAMFAFGEKTLAKREFLQHVLSFSAPSAGAAHPTDNFFSPTAGDSGGGGGDDDSGGDDADR